MKTKQNPPKIPKCYTCEHCAEWHSSVVTYRCRKIRGERDPDNGDYEDEMKIGKLKPACQFYEYRGY